MIRPSFRATGAALASLALVAAGATAARAADGDGTTTIDFLSINDFHGRIDTNTVAFAGTIEQLKAQDPDGTVFLSAGDNVSASLFASAVQDDAPTIDVLNALGLQVSSVGNHEFDKGYSDLTGRIDDRADWPYLGANVYEHGTTTPALPAYQVVTVKGVKVGVIGAVTEETPTLVSPAGVSTLDFGDPVAAINKTADELTDGDPSNGEADVLVATIHEGASEGTPDGATLDQEVAAGGAFADIVTKTSPKVAAIFTGHTHKEYAWQAPVPGASGKTRPIIQTGDYGANVGHVSLTLDATTHAVVSSTVANVPRTTTPAADLVAKYPAVAKVDGIVKAALAYADTVGKQPVGAVTADITTAYTGGSYVKGKYTQPDATDPTKGRDDRASESALGNFVADALRDTLAPESRGGADIGVVNPGGLRAELFKGDDGVITYGEANSVLPFVNNLWTVTLTGAQFKELLEQQWQTDASGNRPTRPYLNLGLSDNVTYTVDTLDAAATPGNHITSVYVDGKPLDPSKEYRIGTFSFLTSGGDNFREFLQGTDAKDSGLVDRDGWIEYLGTHDPASPSFARSHVVVNALPKATRAGDVAKAKVSSLNLTSLGAPRNTSLTEYLVASGGAFDPAKPGTSLGTASVNAAGASSVAVTVPTTTKPGAYDLVLLAKESKTVVRLPLTVKAPLPAVVTKAPTAAPFCSAGQVYLSTSVVNGEAAHKVDIRLTTPFGDKKFSGVAPLTSVSNVFATGKTSVEAGSLTIAAYYYDGTGHYQTSTKAYAARSCS
ncbi:2',3'-cyclic-nucleotide 2'-phosphodiesterase (5'-nucleotidase family) [Luteimicrobium subarcticum]|uniref:2',3'-cyclic-nucleotide 2'-phosphodiesterase (5'-nucleotidase family) n=1 Tax=Luteimicrobium subarcticum TaxID=620910 RepID=A0A2M8WSC3_9MICO|nr:2',3'-cyclic-nucleotide 2'-phosphodiesterase (5'-nucleotidase family) [Luteimicrobium subarcticum]